MTCEIIGRSETSSCYSLWEVSTDNYLGRSPRRSVTTGRRRGAARMLLVSLMRGRPSRPRGHCGDVALAGFTYLRRAVLVSLPAHPPPVQVLNSSGLMRDAGLQAVCQNHFGSN